MTSPQHSFYVMPPQPAEFPSYALYVAGHQAWVNNPDPTAGMTLDQKIALQSQRAAMARSTKATSVVRWCVAGFIGLVIVVLMVGVFAPM